MGLHRVKISERRDKKCLHEINYPLIAFTLVELGKSVPALLRGFDPVNAILTLSFESHYDLQESLLVPLIPVVVCDGISSGVGGKHFTVDDGKEPSIPEQELHGPSPIVIVVPSVA